MLRLFTYLICDLMRNKALALNMRYILDVNMKAVNNSDDYFATKHKTSKNLKKKEKQKMDPLSLLVLVTSYCF